MTSLLIADDHPLFRAALRLAASESLPDCRVKEAADLSGALAALAAEPDTDLVLLDLHMPGSQGLSGLAALRGQHPGVAVLVVSAHDEPRIVRRVLDHGAAGFIPKALDAEEMRTAIRTVLAGDHWTPADIDLSAPVDRETSELVKRLASLTPQQVRVLMMLSEGLLNKQIAYELSVSEATVKAHVSAILQKLGVESRTQAVIVAAKISGSQWRQNEPSA